MENEKTASEAETHKKRAIELLKESQGVHEAAKRGAISESDAIDAVIGLNDEAIDEADKALALEKEFLSKTDSF